MPDMTSRAESGAEGWTGLMPPSSIPSRRRCAVRPPKTTTGGRRLAAGRVVRVAGVWLVRSSDLCGERLERFVWSDRGLGMGSVAAKRGAPFTSIHRLYSTNKCHDDGEGWERRATGGRITSDDCTAQQVQERYRAVTPAWTSRYRSRAIPVRIPVLVSPVHSYSRALSPARGGRLEVVL